jgi:zinc protease
MHGAILEVKEMIAKWKAPALAIAVSAILLGAGTLEAGGSGVKMPELKLQQEKLANGLRVILAVDHSAPVYAIDICYNVGSRNERPGRTGFAHLFEHMMFQGSKNVGKGEHFILIFNNGGGMNGTTNVDRTTYFEELPKNQLDLGLYLEADRMRALNITQANLDNQRKTVQEERRQSYDNQPYAHAQLDIDNLAYDNFAYKHSTIGSMSDLNAASIEDVSKFFHTYYAPNNAVLTLVGDFDPAEALAKIKKYFATIPEQPAPPKVDLTEEAHYGERSETIYDQLARLPEVDIAYHIPPGNTPGNYAMQELAAIMGEGDSSRLYQHLVKDKQLASSVQVYADSRIGTGQFYISANPRPGVKVEDLEKGIDDEIAEVLKSGVTPEELAKAKIELLRQFIDRRRSDLTTAVQIGNYAVYFNDPNLINTITDKRAAVTQADVDAAAKEYLVQDQRTVIVTLPAAMRQTASAAKAAPGGGR